MNEDGVNEGNDRTKGGIKMYAVWWVNGRRHGRHTSRVPFASSRCASAGGLGWTLSAQSSSREVNVAREPARANYVTHASRHIRRALQPRFARIKPRVPVLKTGKENRKQEHGKDGWKLGETVR
jgi:hypothetical protein